MESFRESMRKKRGACEWRELIRRYSEGGESGKEFCAARGLSVITFSKWRRRFREEGNQLPDKLETGSKFVEIQSAQETTGASTGNYAELTFPNGLTLRVRG
jgi:transposase-like protein